MGLVAQPSLAVLSQPYRYIPSLGHVGELLSEVGAGIGPARRVLDPTDLGGHPILGHGHVARLMPEGDRHEPLALLGARS